MKCMLAGALLVWGLLALGMSATAAGAYYGNGDEAFGTRCNCNGPVTQVVNAGTQYITTRRIVNTTSVMPHIHVVDHTRVILHRRTIVHREIVVHRHNTINLDITVNRMNVAHRFQTVHRRQVRNVYQNTRHTIHETRTVRGRDCNCGPDKANYRHSIRWNTDGRFARPHD